MKPVGRAKIPCRILAMNVKKSDFNCYIYTLFLDHFCVLIVKIRR